MHKANTGMQKENDNNHQGNSAAHTGKASGLDGRKSGILRKPLADKMASANAGTPLRRKTTRVQFECEGIHSGRVGSDFCGVLPDESVRYRRLMELSEASRAAENRPSTQSATREARVLANDRASGVQGSLSDNAPKRLFGRKEPHSIAAKTVPSRYADLPMSIVSDLPATSEPERVECATAPAKSSDSNDSSIWSPSSVAMMTGISREKARLFIAPHKAGPQPTALSSTFRVAPRALNGHIWVRLAPTDVIPCSQTRPCSGCRRPDIFQQLP